MLLILFYVGLRFWIRFDAESCARIDRNKSRFKLNWVLDIEVVIIIVVVEVLVTGCRGDESRDH